MAGSKRMGGPHWRRVLATLGNGDARTAYAQIVLGAAPGDVLPDVKEQRRERAITGLLESGLVERLVSGDLVTWWRPRPSSVSCWPSTAPAAADRPGQVYAAGPD
ncbi:hypothetical protein QF031_001651 [Pseudarthrobacter defluvii]|uniref:hypothetical protein n=1 Tax=Pseudarthrobacter defluvii TaxID=410837 RepID=UPI0027884226|nr:hypothetical protein [Pseudarthrobacter defluvii]MDQ0768902.1 hypothetical protein [Pseudarthrobacter defluvii]